MDHLLLDLEIEAACWEFLAQRIRARGGLQLAQPVVIYLDHFCDICEADPCVCEISEADYEYGEPNVSVQTQGMRLEQLESEHGPESSQPKGPAYPGDGWDELTARAAELGAGPETVGEMTERMLQKMGD